MPDNDDRLAMRRDWNERARKDAFYYVATWRKDWTVQEFLESGEEEYRKLVEPVLNEFGFAPGTASVLEVGCGAGRMTGSFARRFSTVYALDISEEMQNLAKRNLAELSNIHWVLSDGSDLAAIDSNSVNLVFCCLVLQHLPTAALVLNYAQEMLRVLEPGGIFLFQVNSMKRPTMNWKGRLAWGAVDFLWTLNLQELSQIAARWLGFDPATAGKSWRGASVPVRDVLEAIRAAGASTVAITDEGTSMTWFRGRKSAPVSGIRP